LVNRYNESEFAIKASQLGVTIGERLTRREWKAIRRRIVDKPRRFSNKFIQSQLSRRNLYRNNIRMIQRNIHLATSSSFAYDVPAPVSIGTSVDAYCKSYKIVQKGKVLSFDFGTAMYRIQFDNHEFGVELCPDTDVASRGNLRLIFRSASTSSKTYLDDIDNFIYSRVVCDDKFCAMQSLPLAGGNIPVSPPISTGATTQSLAERIAELEAFLVLLTTTEKAMHRKTNLLSILDDASTMMITMQQQLVPGDLAINANASNSSDNHHILLSQAARDHIDWLLSNLGRINLILKTSMNHLQTLYIQPDQSNTSIRPSIS
jgi:DIRP